MSFDPIGAFDVNAPLLAEALNAALAIKATFPAIPSGLLKRVYGHWEVEPFGCVDAAYNGVVDLRNNQWGLYLSTDFRNNMPGLNNNPAASHTWQRNTGALGIAIAGMDGATATDFGPDGVQLHELEYLSAFIAAICRHYGLDTLGKVPSPGETHASSNDSGSVPGPINTTGENNIETHATCAMYDDYRGERWDLGVLHAMPSGVSLTDEMRVASAEALRQRIHRYAVGMPA